METEKETMKNEIIEEDEKVEETSESNEIKNSIEEKDQKSTENKKSHQKYFKSKSFMPKNFGKSIKSGASSFTMDSSLNNDPLSSSEEKRARKSFDIEYPTLKRCHSTKKYHYSKNYKKDIIKEEKNEDEDSFCSFASNRSKFSSYTIMPKENNLFLFEKKKLFEENNTNTIKNISTMEPVQETNDENLIFQKPKIQILSDKKEDSELNVITSSKVNLKKTLLEENEIIQEVKELDGIFDEEFDQKLDSIKIKYKMLYDKEEPPALFSGLQGECRPFNDEVPDEIIEENYEDDAKEVIRKNSKIIQRKKNIADEIDDDFKKIKKRNSMLNIINDDKLPIDEKDELNNKDENEEKEDKDDKEEEKEKDDGSDKASKNSK